MPASPFPGFLQSLGLLGIGLVTVFLVLAATGQPASPPATVALLGAVVGTAAALAVGLLAARLPAREALRWGAHPGRGWTALLPMLAGAVLLTSEMANLIQAAWPPPPVFAEMMRRLLTPQGPLEEGAALVLVGCATPAAEEFLFRGLIQRGLAARYGVASGIGLTSFLFAVYHFNPWQGLPALGLGILFGWVTQRSGLIGYAIALHAGNNLLALVAAHLAPPLPGLAPAGGETAHVPPAALVLAAAVLIWGARRFARCFPPAAPVSSPGP